MPPQQLMRPLWLNRPHGEKQVSAPLETGGRGHPLIGDVLTTHPNLGRTGCESNREQEKKTVFSNAAWDSWCATCRSRRRHRKERFYTHTWRFRSEKRQTDRLARWPSSVLQAPTSLAESGQSPDSDVEFGAYPSDSASLRSIWYVGFRLEASTTRRSVRS